MAIRRNFLSPFCPFNFNTFIIIFMVIRSSKSFNSLPTTLKPSLNEFKVYLTPHCSLFNCEKRRQSHVVFQSFHLLTLIQSIYKYVSSLSHGNKKTKRSWMEQSENFFKWCGSIWVLFSCLSTDNDNEHIGVERGIEEKRTQGIKALKD